MTDDDTGGTKSTQTRHPYTNDILAGMLVGMAVVSTGVYVSRGASVPVWLAGIDTLAVIAAVAWSFGSGALKAAKDAIGGVKD